MTCASRKDKKVMHKLQTSNKKELQLTKATKYQISLFPWGIHCIFLVRHLPQTRRLTSIQKSFQDLETPQSWFRKWEFVAFLASLWEIRRVLFRFCSEKREGRTILAKFVISISRNLRGKTNFLWKPIRGERLGDSQPTIMLAFVGPPLGGPTWSVTQLHTVSVGHAGGSNDFRRRFFWDPQGEVVVRFWQIGSEDPVRFWQIGWMQLENKKPTLNWSWRFLGFSVEVGVWCSQIHRFLFCSVLFPKSGQSSQNPKWLNDHGV